MYIKDLSISLTKIVTLHVSHIVAHIYYEQKTGWPAPGKTLENLEKPGICNRGLKNLEKLFI